MARIFKATYTMAGRHGERLRRRSRKWYIEYRNAEGVIRRVPGYVDKAATLQRAGELERETERRKAGLIDKYVEYRRRPLAEHVADWQAALLAKGGTARHASISAKRVARLLDRCRHNFWPEVSASRIEICLADLRSGGLSAESSNHHLRAIKGFCRWMVRDGRAAESPVAHLQLLNSKTDRRHDRRSLSPDELARLFDTAKNGPVRFGISGPDRAILYRVAVDTGLRSGELRSLTVGSFRLEADPPTVTVLAGYSKRRRDDTLPIRAELARALRKYFMDRVSAATALRMPSPSNVVRMLRNDFDASRTTWIEEVKSDPSEQARREASTFLAYRDVAGRVADFHALRHTFVTNLARGGVHPKVAQQLARHSTITLTMDRYTHTEIGDLANALKALPIVAGAEHSGPPAAEGMCPRGAISSSSSAHVEDPVLGVLLAQTPVKNGQEQSDAVGIASHEGFDVNARNIIPMPSLDAERRGKSVCVELGRAGVEPATHGFSVEKDNDHTPEVDDNPAA